MYRALILAKSLSFVIYNLVYLRTKGRSSPTQQNPIRFSLLQLPSLKSQLSENPASYPHYDRVSLEVTSPHARLSLRNIEREVLHYLLTPFPHLCAETDSRRTMGSRLADYMNGPALNGTNGNRQSLDGTLDLDTSNRNNGTGLNADDMSNYRPPTAETLYTPVVDTPSMAGYWACCYGCGPNNPALTGDFCPVCGHRKCDDCVKY
jgi:hypothetical protein